MNDLNEIRKFRGRRFLFKVENSADYKAYTKFERIRLEIWGDPSDTMPGERNMLNENYFDKGSALFIAVYAEDEAGNFMEDWDHFAGFSYGFVGIRDKAVGFSRLDNLRFYSQYTAARKEYRKYGLGIAIKEFQKKALVNLFRIFEVICTFDPLTGVNAYRNISYFGMSILAYKEALYDDFFGHLNRRDIPCDRFVLSWDLKKDREKTGCGRERYLERGLPVIESELIRIKGKSGPLYLRGVKGFDVNTEGEMLLVEIPYDFYTMLQETDVPGREAREIPLEWRMATRTVFRNLFRKGYKVLDFCTSEDAGRKRNYYVLIRGKTT